MRQSRRSVSRWRLTLPQFDVLAELARASDGGFSFVELSRLLLVTSGNLTGVVDRLESEGLVRREPDPLDRRVIRIKLTEKGRRLTQKILGTHAEDVQSALSFMPRERLELLSELLGELREGLRGARAEIGWKRRRVQRTLPNTTPEGTPASRISVAPPR
jgi:DNA-binding MarR family transcriptional regulator